MLVLDRGQDSRVEARKALICRACTGIVEARIPHRKQVLANAAKLGKLVVNALVRYLSREDFRVVELSLSPGEVSDSGLQKLDHKQGVVVRVWILKLFKGPLRY